MQLKTIYGYLLAAKRPIEFFGAVSSAEELHKVYKQFARLIHPDKVTPDNRYIAEEAFPLLTNMYEQGKTEFSNNIYSVVNPVEFYKLQVPLFTVDIRSSYKLYEHTWSGGTSDVFKGTVDDSDIIYLKIVRDRADNALNVKEFSTLSKLKHRSLPFVEKKVLINRCAGFFMREIPGVTAEELREQQYPDGLETIHVIWILERLLSVVGYFHHNKYLHANIKPENIVITKSNHNASLVGCTWCVDGNLPNSHYQIVNEGFSAPEISKTEALNPSSDIYSLSAVMAYLSKNESVDPCLKELYDKMRDTSGSRRANDAWKIWDELRVIRKANFGDICFVPLN